MKEDAGMWPFWICTVGHDRSFRKFLVHNEDEEARVLADIRSGVFGGSYWREWDDQPGPKMSECYESQRSEAVN